MGMSNKAKKQDSATNYGFIVESRRTIVRKLIKQGYNKEQANKFYDEKLAEFTFKQKLKLGTT